LISPRSPSYERAWRELSDPGQFGDAATVALLARLSEAEQNAHDVCSALQSQLGADPLADTVREHAALHADRRAALSEMVERLGGSAPTPEECRPLLSGSLYAAEAATSVEQAKQSLLLMREELRAQYAAALDAQELPQVSKAQRESLAALLPGLRPE
jgi:hypothetical protein